MTEPEEALDLTPLVKTSLAWDVLPHDQVPEWLTRLGLTPSADGEGNEHYEADVRAASIAPLMGTAEVYSALIAEIQATYLSPLDNPTKDQIARSAACIFPLIRNASMSILAQFMEHGLITYGPAIEELIGG